jgi:hypothetical protein
LDEKLQNIDEGGSVKIDAQRILEINMKCDEILQELR